MTVTVKMLKKIPDTSHQNHFIVMGHQEEEEEEKKEKKKKEQRKTTYLSLPDVQNFYNYCIN